MHKENVFKLPEFRSLPFTSLSAEPFEDARQKHFQANLSFNICFFTPPAPLHTYARPTSPFPRSMSTHVTREISRLLVNIGTLSLILTCALLSYHYHTAYQQPPGWCADKTHVLIRQVLDVNQPQLVTNAVMVLLRATDCQKSRPIILSFTCCNHLDWR